MKDKRKGRTLTWELRVGIDGLKTTVCTLTMPVDLSGDGTPLMSMRIDPHVRESGKAAAMACSFMEHYLRDARHRPDGMAMETVHTSDGRIVEETR